MISGTVAELLSELAVTKSHSRPRVSNDNPFSEANFKTLKYRPDYPKRFQGIQHARSWATEFFHWYNYEHYHSGIGFLHPADLHAGRHEQVIEKRQATLDAGCCLRQAPREIQSKTKSEQATRGNLDQQATHELESVRLATQN